MTDQITAKTVDWARAHDWGHYAYLYSPTIPGLKPMIGGLIECASSPFLCDSKFVSFTSRRKLQAWAGY